MSGLSLAAPPPLRWRIFSGMKIKKTALNQKSGHDPPKKGNLLFIEVGCYIIRATGAPSNTCYVYHFPPMISHVSGSTCGIRHNNNNNNRNQLYPPSHTME